MMSLITRCYVLIVYSEPLVTSVLSHSSDSHDNPSMAEILRIYSLNHTRGHHNGSTAMSHSARSTVVLSITPAIFGAVLVFLILGSILHYRCKVRAKIDIIWREFARVDEVLANIRAKELSKSGGNLHVEDTVGTSLLSAMSASTRLYTVHEGNAQETQTKTTTLYPNAHVQIKTETVDLDLQGSASSGLSTTPKRSPCSYRTRLISRSVDSPDRLTQLRVQFKGPKLARPPQPPPTPPPLPPPHPAKSPTPSDKQPSPVKQSGKCAKELRKKFSRQKLIDHSISSEADRDQQEAKCNSQTDQISRETPTPEPENCTKKQRANPVYTITNSVDSSNIHLSTSNSRHPKYLPKFNSLPTPVPDTMIM